MKKVFLCFLGLLFFGLLYADNIMIEPYSEVIYEDDEYVRVAMITFPDNLSTLDYAILTWESERQILPRYYDEMRSENDYGVVFKNENYCLMISVYGNAIIGHFQSPTNKYFIKTDDSQKSHLYELDANFNKCSKDDLVNPFSLTEDSLYLRSLSDSIIRIVVLYASSLNTNLATMRNTMNQAVLSANYAFLKSNISAKLELAYLGETNYDCVNFSTDLNRFKSKIDNYMDEIHTLRNDYYADVCVLVTSSTDLCGKAAAIKADESSAFVAISANISCMWDHTLDHEIGHLIGCRHDRYVDWLNVPYQYGHGYVLLNGNNSWRTIMAYDDACLDNFDTYCHSIDNWSNPEVTHQSVPTGDVVYCNNARVWNNRRLTVANFRNTPSDLSVTGLHSINTAYAYLPAKSTIAISGSYIVFPNSTCVYNAGEEIRISNGFIALSGSNLQFKITPGGPASVPIRNREDQSYYCKEGTTALASDAQNTFSVFPNPATDHITISCSEPIEHTTIYDLNGAAVLQTNDTELNISTLPSGIYLIRSTTAQGTTQQAKIIHL